MGSLEGRVAILTGAGRGFGASVARLLAAEGARVVANDLGVSLEGEEPDSGPADEVVARITEAGGEAVANHGSTGPTRGPRRKGGARRARQAGTQADPGDGALLGGRPTR